MFGLFNPATVWVLIPLAAIFAGVWRQSLRVKERDLDRLSGETVRLTDQSSRRIDELEQRVRILERIVTDRGLGLAEEIERLRDLPARADRPMN
jgi:hypothetical protein